MRRGAGIALTAAALSVTVGVLVGAVITIGSNARAVSPSIPADAGPSTPGSASFPAYSAPSSQIVGSVQSSVEAVQSSVEAVPSGVTATGVLSTNSSAAAVPPTPPSPTRPGSTAARPTPAGSPAVRSGQRTNTRPTLPTFVLVTVTRSTTRSPVPSSSPIAAPKPVPQPVPTMASAPAAGAGCSPFGAKGTVAGGSNVFCQHDFATGMLAWRAVVNGGGCLNRQLTGLGADGHSYACRPDASGLDHWRPA